MTLQGGASSDEEFVKPEFVGHLVHELKSPFNGILGLTEPMLTRGPASEHKGISCLYSAGVRSLCFIERTFGSDTPFTTRAPTVAEPFDLAALVNEACTLLGSSEETNGIHVRSPGVSLLHSLPLNGLEVTGDACQTASCLYQLVRNAVVYTDAGSVSITHRYEAGSHIVIVITDTGSGMHSDRIRPFVRHSDRSPGSLGLGLFRTKQYIESVGGKLCVQSEIGTGTVAELWVPKVAATNVGPQDAWRAWESPIDHSRSEKWRAQRRALGILALDLLPVHYGMAGMAHSLMDAEVKLSTKKQLGLVHRSILRSIENLTLLRDATLLCETLVIFQSIQVNLAEIAKRIESELSIAVDKGGKPVKKASVEFINGIQGGVIATDPYYLYRMLYQLCENALKFTSNGRVCLSTAGFGMIVVSDTGCGFDQTMVDDIRKPFHRLQPDKCYGFGLGLTMVSDIAAKLGATVRFDSIKETGTTVTVQLAGSNAVPAPVIPVKATAAPRRPMDSFQFPYTDLSKSWVDETFATRDAQPAYHGRDTDEGVDQADPLSVHAALNSLARSVDLLKEQIAIATSTSMRIKDMFSHVDRK